MSFLFAIHSMSPCRIGITPRTRTTSERSSCERPRQVRRLAAPPSLRTTQPRSCGGSSITTNARAAVVPTGSRTTATRCARTGIGAICRTCTCSTTATCGLIGTARCGASPRRSTSRSTRPGGPRSSRRPASDRCDRGPATPRPRHTSTCGDRRRSSSGSEAGATGRRCSARTTLRISKSACVRSQATLRAGPSVAALHSSRRRRMARILIVGGGYIGMYAARRLERRLDPRAHQLVLVNPDNFMLYQPFLPEVASGLIDPRAVVVPLRSVLRRTELVVGEVEGVDLAAKRASVHLAGGDPRDVEFDVLIMGAGSWSRTLAIPGLAEHGVGFKDLAEAIWLRNRVLSQLDRAAELADPASRRAALTFVFVGAGFAGIEALGELEDLARNATNTIPSLDRAEQRWVMVEAAPRILPELEPDLASYAADRLRERDIEIHTTTRLERIDDGVVQLSDGDPFRAETLVWTAGVRPSPLAADSGFPVDDRGRITVDRALRVVGIEGVWAAGDVAAVPDEHATQGTSPPTAQHALRQARVLADNVAASLDGGRLRPFRYENKGMLCSLGHYRGVANPLGIRVKGFPAWFLHRTYHLLYMPSFARKARIALDWTIALLFPRDLAQLGSLEHPRDAFRRAAGGDG